MAITTLDQVLSQGERIKNYTDKKTDDGFQINDNNLLFRESNEILISGINATVNANGNVDGVTISSGKVILSPDVFGEQDIKLEKASGIYSGYELDLSDGTTLTPPVYTPSILSVANGVVTYQSYSQTEGYILDSNSSIISYGEEIPQRNCTITGLQDSLTVDNGTIAGMNFDYDSVTITADAVSNSNNVSVNGGFMKITADNYGENFTIAGGNYSDTISNSGNNTYIKALNGNDEVLNFGSYVSIDAGVGNDTITNSADYVSIQAGYGNDAIFLNNVTNNTIVAGVGTDTVFAYQSGGNIYQFTASQGTNYIYGFQDGDTVSFGSVADSAIYKTITSDGVVLSLKNASGYDTTKVIIKDTLSATSELTDLQNTFTAKKSAFEVAKQNFLTNHGETEKLAYENARADFISATQNLNAYISDSTLYPKLPHNKTIAIQSADGINIYTVPKLLVGTDYSDYSVDGVPAENGVGDLIVSGADMDNYTVDAKYGHDFIFSNSSNVSINSGVSNDTISLGASAFHNTVNGGGGNDVIYSSGNGNLFELNTSRNDSIYADTIYGFSGSDTLTLYGASKFDTLITADGFKVIARDQYNYDGGSVFIFPANGVNTINVNNEVVIIPPTPTIKILPSGISLKGNETLQGFSSDDTLMFYDLTYSTSLDGDSFKIISKYENYTYGTILITDIGDEVKTININDDVVLIPMTKNVSSGDNITNTDNQCVIWGVSNSTINNTADYVSIQSSFINNSGSYSSLAGVGLDTITNTGDYVTISSGSSDDVIVNEGGYVFINAGTGRDTIFLSSGVDSLGNEHTVKPTAAHCTIIGGGADDIIYGNDNGHVYRYTKGEGKDSIFGFGVNDTLQIANNVSGTVSYSVKYANVTRNTEIDYDYNDVLIAVGGSSSITLKELPVGRNVRLDVCDYAFNIQKTEFYTVPKYHGMTSLDGAFSNTIDNMYINGSTADDTISNSADYVSICGGTGNDSINNSGTNTTYIFGTNDGADTITGFNQATDILYCSTAGTTFSFAVQGTDVLVTIGSTTVLLEGISSGNIRYQCSGGDVQTYTIT